MQQWGKCPSSYGKVRGRFRRKLCLCGGIKAAYGLLQRKWRAFQRSNKTFGFALCFAHFPPELWKNALVFIFPRQKHTVRLERITHAKLAPDYHWVSCGQCWVVAKFRLPQSPLRKCRQGLQIQKRAALGRLSDLHNYFAYSTALVSRSR